jgi:hypothetical protein
MADTIKIFTLFGGVRGLARALKLPPSTCQRWKDSGVIPSRRQPEVLAAAEERQLDITMADVIGKSPKAEHQQSTEAA